MNLLLYKKKDQDFDNNNKFNCMNLLNLFKVFILYIFVLYEFLCNIEYKIYKS